MGLSQEQLRRYKRHMKYEEADQHDLNEIVSLLSSAGLPSEDVGLHLESFVVARDGGNVVGAVGIQLYGSDALLRSLVVHPGARGRGISRQLAQRIVAAAERHGVKHLYLLTTTIESLCEKWGFRKIGRKDAPEAIKNTAEFKGLCPSVAVLMYQSVGEIIKESI